MHSRVQLLLAAPLLGIDQLARVEVRFAGLTAVHDHPPGISLAGPTCSLRLADSKAVLAGAPGRAGVGGDDEDLVSASHVKREAALLLSARIGKDSLFDACIGSGGREEK